MTKKNIDCCVLEKAFLVNSPLLEVEIDCFNITGNDITTRLILSTNLFFKINVFKN